MQIDKNLQKILVVSDDDHEMEVEPKVERAESSNIMVDKVSEKAEYNNIMVDKVALNLPVVMTKRNNAKIAQVNNFVYQMPFF